MLLSKLTAPCGLGATTPTGQIGDGTVVDKSSPVQVGALTNWAQVDGGYFHCGAIKTDGTIWTWGNNGFGQLGIDNETHKSSPVQIGALTNWSQVSAGSDAHTAAVKTDGTIWTWGRNNNGRLGDGTVVNKSSPVQIGALTNWSQVSAGQGQTASIKTDGTVWAWGYNTNGQIGDGTVVAKSSPVQIGALTNWFQVSAGGTHVVAIVQETTN
jgi:alpha-tubulin suppressor-like RCC1 family protein